MCYLPHIQCDYFVSEHEEDLVDTLQDPEQTQEEMEEELCYAVTGRSHMTTT